MIKISLSQSQQAFLPRQCRSRCLCQLCDMMCVGQEDEDARLWSPEYVLRGLAEAKID